MKRVTEREQPRVRTYYDLLADRWNVFLVPSSLFLLSLRRPSFFLFHPTLPCPPCVPLSRTSLPHSSPPLPALRSSVSSSLCTTSSSYHRALYYYYGVLHFHSVASKNKVPDSQCMNDNHTERNTAQTCSLSVSVFVSRAVRWSLFVAFQGLLLLHYRNSLSFCLPAVSLLCLHTTPSFSFRHFLSSCFSLFLSRSIFFPLALPPQLLFPT